MEWSGIVIHHTASPDVSWREIDRWHRERGWSGIGYHFLIRENGFIELGRNIDTQGAHARGKNDTHIGIAYTGEGNERPPTLTQISSLCFLVGGLMNKYGIAWENIEGHHEECPGRLFPWGALKLKVRFFNGEQILEGG